MLDELLGKWNEILSKPNRWFKRARARYALSEDYLQELAKNIRDQTSAIQLLLQVFLTHHNFEVTTNLEKGYPKEFPSPWGFYPEAEINADIVSETDIKLGLTSQDAALFQLQLDQYQEEVYIQWDNPASTQAPPFTTETETCTLSFDTTCDENRVAEWVVKGVNAQIHPSSEVDKVIEFKGHTLASSSRISLSFQAKDCGPARRAVFCVVSGDDLPFDLLLGATDCLKFGFLVEPPILGLAAPKLSAAERDEQEERDALQSKKKKDQKDKQRQSSKKKKSGEGRDQDAESSRRRPSMIRRILDLPQ